MVRAASASLNIFETLLDSELASFAFIRSKLELTLAFLVASWLTFKAATDAMTFSLAAVASALAA